MANEYGSYKGVTYKNGQLPKKFLKRLDGDNNDTAADRAMLREDAADAWNAGRAAVLRKTGLVLTVRGWYRLRSQQELFFFQRYRKNAYSPWGDYRWYNGVRYGRVAGAPAAIPGTSNHGLGTTVDVVDFGAFGTNGNARRAAAIGILREYGWSTAEGDSIDEPWHLNYVDALNRHKNESQPSEPVKRKPTRLPTIAKGSKSAWVPVVQRLVGAKSDGRFGNETKAKVQAFQRRHGLPQTGTVDLRTWVQFLYGHALERGDRGDRVKVLQNMVGLSGRDADGEFGAKTHGRVVETQRGLGIGVDGIAGREFRDAYLKHFGLR